MQGIEKQVDIDAQIEQALSESFVVSLGGRLGQKQAWGQGLAVRAPKTSDWGGIRSQLGNSLAIAAAGMGLRAIGLVAYYEVQLCLLYHCGCIFSMVDAPEVLNPRFKTYPGCLTSNFPKNKQRKMLKNIFPQTQLLLVIARWTQKAESPIMIVVAVAWLRM